jgi:sigma-B regulation protein RsbU (phosphoserine phosphatase)
MPNSSWSAARFREPAELLDFFLEIAAVTSETLDLDRLLAGVAGLVTSAIPCELFAILLYSEKQRGLTIHYAMGHREEVIGKLVIPLGEGITGAAALARETILVGDVRSDPRYLHALDAVRTELAVPMVVHGKLVGVIDIESTRLNAYGDYERSTLQLIASRVAAAIFNARLHRRVERQNRTLRTLARLSPEFSSILDLDELLKKIADAVRMLIRYDSFNIFLVDEQQQVLRQRSSRRYDERSSLDNIPIGKGITGTAAQTREIIRVDDALTDPRYIPSHPDIRSEVAVPLVVRDRVIGIMDVESERIGFFNEEHVRTLSLIAPQIAASVENARLYEEVSRNKARMEGDLRAARELQTVLLPRQAPDVAGLEIATGVRSAREISGDLYEFIRQGRDRSAVVMGDVSGKGAAAALYAAMVSGLLRTLAPNFNRPSKLLMNLNDALMERRADARFVTLLCLHWQPRTRELRMANAGGMPPLIMHNGQMYKPRVEGIPLGLLENREYDEVTYQAHEGDLVVLYSDGLEDQYNPAAEHFGRGRLARHLERVWRQSPQDIVSSVFRELDRFAGGTATFDDQTLIVMRVR